MMNWLTQKQRARWINVKSMAVQIGVMIKCTDQHWSFIVILWWTGVHIIIFFIMTPSSRDPSLSLAPGRPPKSKSNSSIQVVLNITRIPVKTNKALGALCKSLTAEQACLVWQECSPNNLILLSIYYIYIIWDITILYREEHRWSEWSKWSRVSVYIVDMV